MPRQLVLGNGELLVTFDARLNMRDFYYPYVGLWNQLGGFKNRIGVWVEGRFSWVEEDGWRIRLGYRDGSLVGEARAVNDPLGVALDVQDAVYHAANIYLKRVTVRNLAPEARKIRLFFTQDFSIDESNVGDTAVYDPDLNLVYHYKRDRYFMVNGCSRQGGIAQFSTGIKRFRGAEGTWRDAEDGRLEGNAIVQGSVDSAVGFDLFLPAGAAEDVWYWIAAARRYGDCRDLDRHVRERSPAALLRRTERYWRRWLDKAGVDLDDLPKELVRLYRLSLLVVRAHLDRRGGIVASADGEILDAQRDHYGYVWPRDGALAAVALARAGYPEAALPFFHFCRQVLTRGGFLLHKYNPDGSLGSSWHPWFLNGRKQLPIQEDETGLVLHALWEYYRASGDIEQVAALVPTLVEPAADFLCEYVDPDLNLPQDSYDLWEERRGIFTFTAAAVHGGLVGAAKLVALQGGVQRARRYRQTARRIREGIAAHLYDPSLGRFIRGLHRGSDGSVEQDATLESSVFGLVDYGVLAASDPRVVSTMRAIEAGLWVKTPVGGIARYAGDHYCRRHWDLATVPGNPWFITTLWLAGWYADTAASRHDLDRCLALLEWVREYALPSGLLSEQIDPFSGEAISVAPLTWSHAAYVLTVLRYAEARRRVAAAAAPSPAPAQRVP